jgi:hypothetical protein
MCVGRGVSKRVEDGSFRGGPPAGRKRVGHGKPGSNVRESMATPCHTAMPLGVGAVTLGECFSEELNGACAVSALVVPDGAVLMGASGFYH